MRALIIGYGSIGRRHTRLLSELGCSTAVLSAREIDYAPRFDKLSDALRLFQPSYIVISNRTVEHYPTIIDLAEQGYSGIVLCEKPLFDTMQSIYDKNFSRLLVAYNLRFHPIIRKLRNLLRNEKVLTAHAYVGQYLPDWRPAANYRDAYSAHKNQGGGVLRDLSHELDYLKWILGGWKRLVAIGGKYSDLDIDSDDVYSLLITSDACPVVTVQLNYLDRVSRRELIINTSCHTIKADLVASQLLIDEQTEYFPVERDFTYRAMHQAVIAGDFSSICSQAEGMEALKIIAAAEQSSYKKAWVINDETLYDLCKRRL